MQSHEMQSLEVAVKTLDHFKGELPKYESQLASGVDVRAQLQNDMLIEPGQRKIVPTGLSVQIPPGYEIQIRPRSGWAAKKGMTCLNTPGTIDADYRGEIGVILYNAGSEPVEIKDQDRIAQMVLCPVLQIRWRMIDQLQSTDRGAGGFGSTGV